MPRPPFLDIPRKEIACALARAGASGRWIAAYLGCDESTIRYALANDESFRMRYLQARAAMQIDHLAHITRAAAKSWRASVWLLERLFPKEFNLRNRPQETQLDEFGFAVGTEPNDVAASEMVPDDSPTTDHCPPTTDSDSPAPDSDHDSPTPNPQSPIPSPEPMNLRSFETDFLCDAVAGRDLAPSGYAFWDSFQNPRPLFATVKPNHPLLNYGVGPPPISPKPYNALREKIINEGLRGCEKIEIGTVLAQLVVLLASLATTICRTSTW